MTLDESIDELARELTRSLLEVLELQREHVLELARVAIAEATAPPADPEPPRRPRARRARRRRPASPPASIPPDDYSTNPGSEPDDGGGESEESLPPAPPVLEAPVERAPDGGLVHGLETERPSWADQAREVARQRRKAGA